MKIVISADHRGNWPADVTQTYPCIFLVRDNWNDYGFETFFTAHLRLSEADQLELGGVKIAFFEHQPTDNMRDISPNVFPDGLPDNHFSLGQKLSYYNRLAGIPDASIRRDYARSMRDIPILNLLSERLQVEPAFENSLLRTSGAREALDKAPELFGSEKRVVDAFDFVTMLHGAGAEHRIPFNFSPKGPLPNRLNALVGVNGVGKTQLMARLAMLLTSFEEDGNRELRVAKGGSLRDIGSLDPVPSFYSVIAVSFSAFDDFERPTAQDSGIFRYTYCGLREGDGRVADDNAMAMRIPVMLQAMDKRRGDMALACLAEGLGQQLNVEEVATVAFYRSLSAGQRIVANIIAELCLHLQSRSLVLLDEPETHLHPQLITRLTAVLQALLDGFDSVAVIATHSPIVIQQIRAEHVHIVRRLDGNIPLVDPSPIETFGENLSDIIRVVFDSPEADRGYQQMLDDLLAEYGTPDAVEALFDGRLGFNAQSYLRSREAPR